VRQAVKRLFGNGYRSMINPSVGRSNSFMLAIVGEAETGNAGEHPVEE